MMILAVMSYLVCLLVSSFHLVARLVHLIVIVSSHLVILSLCCLIVFLSACRIEIRTARYERHDEAIRWAARDYLIDGGGAFSCSCLLA